MWVAFWRAAETDDLVRAYDCSELRVRQGSGPLSAAESREDEDGPLLSDIVSRGFSGETGRKGGKAG